MKTIGHCMSQRAIGGDVTSCRPQGVDDNTIGIAALAALDQGLAPGEPTSESDILIGTRCPTIYS